MESTFPMKRREFLLGQVQSDRKNSVLTTGLEPYTGAWSFAEASHLLRRTMFGAKKEDVDSILKGSLPAAVDGLLSNSIPVEPAIPVYYVAFDDAEVGDPWINVPYREKHDDERVGYLRSWWYWRMSTQNISIVEKMTLFWHNHFATDSGSVKNAQYMYKQNVLLRKNALGNFKELVNAITLDPAMLRFLNGNTNTKAGPNENYARELQELFTIGKGPEIQPGNYTHYTEDDIKAAARILTGWKDDQASVSITFADSEHDSLDKKFSTNYGSIVIKGRSGQTGAEAELDELLTMIFSQGETAKYLCRKIYRWFVSTEITPDIEQNIIIPLADTLRSNNYEIKPVLTKLLQSAHFFDPAIRGGIIKNPLDYCVGAFRTLPIDRFVPETYPVMHFCFLRVNQFAAAMQMTPLHLPSVAGIPELYETPNFDKLWINEDTLQTRVQLIDQLTTTEFPFNKDIDRVLYDVIAYAKKTSDPSKADVIVSDWSNFILAVQLTDLQKQTLQSEMLGAMTPSEWTISWNDYIETPEDQAKTKTVEDKLRLLLRNMMGLAEYQLM